MGFAVCVGNASLASMELRWVRRSKCDDAPRSIPIFISTLKKDVNLEELRQLYSRCDHSCDRLSKNGSGIVDMKKLRTAVSHSDVVVSVFCKPHHTALVEDDEQESLSSSLRKQNKDESSLGDMFQEVLPLAPSNGQLVGFGRAYSDYGLTASIHDLIVFFLSIFTSFKDCLVEFCFHYQVYLRCRTLCFGAKMCNLVSVSSRFYLHYNEWGLVN